MFMIGIDPHKGSHTAAAVDRSAMVIDTIGSRSNAGPPMEIWARPGSATSPSEASRQSSTALGIFGNRDPSCRGSSTVAYLLLPDCWTSASSRWR